MKKVFSVFCLLVLMVSSVSAEQITYDIPQEAKPVNNVLSVGNIGFTSESVSGYLVKGNLDNGVFTPDFTTKQSLNFTGDYYDLFFAVSEVDMQKVALAITTVLQQMEMDAIAAQAAADAAAADAADDAE